MASSHQKRNSVAPSVPTKLPCFNVILVILAMPRYHRIAGLGKLRTWTRPKISNLHLWSCVQAINNHHTLSTLLISSILLIDVQSPNCHSLFNHSRIKDCDHTLIAWHFVVASRFISLLSSPYNCVCLASTS